MDIAGWKRMQRLLNIYQIVTFDIFYLAGEPGFEPRLTVLETAVLPLYYSPKLWVTNRSPTGIVD